MRNIDLQSSQIQNADENLSKQAQLRQHNPIASSFSYSLLRHGHLDIHQHPYLSRECRRDHSLSFNMTRVRMAMMSGPRAMAAVLG